MSYPSHVHSLAINDMHQVAVTQARNSCTCVHHWSKSMGKTCFLRGVREPRSYPTAFLLFWVFCSMSGDYIWYHLIHFCSWFILRFLHQFVPHDISLFGFKNLRLSTWMSQGHPRTVDFCGTHISRINSFHKLLVLLERGDGHQLSDYQCWGCGLNHPVLIGISQLEDRFSLAWTIWTAVGSEVWNLKTYTPED